MSHPESSASLPAGKNIVANSRRLPAHAAAAGQLPPPVLLLAVQLLSNVPPNDAQIADLSQAVLDQTATLVPGGASLAVALAAGNLFQVRIGIFSRRPDAGERAAAEAALAALELTTSVIPLRNLAIFVTLGLLDSAADAELPGLRNDAGDDAEITDIDVRFDAAKGDLVTELTFVRDGLFDGPWVATLTDNPLRTDLAGPQVGGEPRHRFACGPATVEVRGGLGRRRLERKLQERQPTGVLSALLERLQITTLLLGPNLGDPADPSDDQPPQAAELSWFAVERRADGVRLKGGLGLRPRSPEIRSIQPARLLALKTQPSLSVRLRATLADFREPLTFNWTLPQGGSFPNPADPNPRLLFDLAGSDPGEVFAKQVQVEVKDVDGLFRSLTRTIEVEIFDESEFPDEFGDGKPSPH